MNIGRCPVCHSRLSLEQVIQDEAARELLALVAKLPDWLATPLVVYLGLFRPSTRDLANDRALKLAREALALSTEQPLLATALAETVQAMRAKQDEGGFKPLTNHQYLKRVLESVAVKGVSNTALTRVTSAPQQGKPVSKTAQTIELLKYYPSPDGVPEWFTRTVCGSLAELMLLGLDGVPPADTMSLVVERWLVELWPKREWRQECRFRGAARLRSAFVQSAESAKRWPSTKDILGLIPKA